MSKATTFVDQACKKITLCTDDEYQTQAATATADAECADLTPCEKGFIVIKKPTKTSNWVCAAPPDEEFGDPDKCKKELDTFKITLTGTYRITATGAGGGDWGEHRGPKQEGGKGAKVSANFDLEKDDVLHILVGCSAPYKGDLDGGEGCSLKGGNHDSGGGGGSFVSLNGRANRNQVLIVGGGGGGSDPHNCASGAGKGDCRHAAVEVTGGGNGNAKSGCGHSGASNNYAGGTGGARGKGEGCCGDGGAGIDQTGEGGGKTTSYPFIGTSAAKAGTTVRGGGCGTGASCLGGYGGAGPDGNNGAGGGGGYSGGGGACCDGGGGGSYVNPERGSSAKATAENLEHGTVVIKFLG